MRYIFLLFLFGILSAAFIIDDTYFKISKKDVMLKIPKGFPKPFYRFEKNKITPEGFILGRQLFYDPILSKDSTVSCATCHQRFAAFAHIDHALSHGIDGAIGTRNVSALQNLIWKDTYMWDGGINHLEVQPINPITSQVEMSESLEHNISKLRSNKDYVLLFKNAFGDTVINSQRMLKALAQFTGLMISSNARYDKYMSGKDTFSSAEKNGLKLFREKCADCHKEPLFTDNSYRNNGLKPDSSLMDKGRGKITGSGKDDYAFKVPSLRNVALTHPYMHDGRFKKLSEVLNHYANSEKYFAGADSALYKIGQLNDMERKDIVAFLLTLTDKEFVFDRRFADPNVQVSK